MSDRTHKNRGILGLAPVTRGVAFAMLEGENTLVDRGIKSVTGDNKNAGALRKVKALVAEFEPDVIVLEDVEASESRRSDRIRVLCRQIMAWASTVKVKVVVFSRQRVQQALFAEGRGTKQQIAGVLAKIFHEEIGFLMPPEKRAWESENYWMAVFDALALVVTLRLRRQRRQPDGRDSSPPGGSHNGAIGDGSRPGASYDHPQVQ